MIIANNRKTARRYEIIRKFEAGICLTGAEVKSLRYKHVSMSSSYVIEKKGELWLAGLKIGNYKFAQKPIQERKIKLLLNKREVDHIVSRIHERGLTVIPLSIYTKRQWIKIEIALAKGLKQKDLKAKEKRLDRERKREARLATYRKQY